MIVVADTTPLNYLILIDEIDLLPFLFGRVLIPAAALEELNHRASPPKVRQWIAHPPTWLQVCTPTPMLNPALIDLDPGEREAIQLALELGVTTILLDESAGRKAAELLHLEVRGTLGILERAARMGRIEFHPALSKLEQTSFRLSPAVRAAFLNRNP